VQVFLAATKYLSVSEVSRYGALPAKNVVTGWKFWKSQNQAVASS
jgi:hypothetical protein